MTEIKIYHSNTYSSHNLDYFLEDAREKRHYEEVVNDILDLYESDFDLDNILVSVYEYLNTLKTL